MYLDIRFYLKCLAPFLLVQKQLPKVFCGSGCSQVFRRINRGAPVPGSIF